jgi:hypothetical protein
VRFLVDFSYKYCYNVLYKKYKFERNVKDMMEGLFGFPEAECKKDKIKRPEKMNGFEASIDIWGGYACHCSKCRKERGEK